jgi:hypothetical protein
MGSAFLLNQEDMWDRLATLGIGQGTREVVASLFTVSSAQSLCPHSYSPHLAAGSPNFYRDGRLVPVGASPHSTQSLVI